MTMQAFFYPLADEIPALLTAGEIFTAYLQVEDSDFVRLNRNRVRQAGHVRQLELSLDLIEGQRHVAGNCNLSGDMGRDLGVIRELLAILRGQRQLLPEDPYLLYATEVQDTEEITEYPVPDAQAAVHEIVAAAQGLDLVGLWASGALYRGFANSLGQRNWYSTANFNFDWSCYYHSDKAVKASYAGFEWSQDKLNQQMEAVRTELALITKPPKTLEPGKYRVYLVPSALKEIFGLLCWDSFGIKNHRTRQTALIKMVQDGRRLHPEVNLIENNREGMAPQFTEVGFLKPNQVSFIAQGAYQDCLVSPRSSKEYHLPVNVGEEAPESLDLAAGRLSKNEILRQLDTGVYINNLWYCNFSDRNEARITGMTRYACFWVENGKLTAPLNVMRFDDSLYRMLGENLLGLTQERDFIFDPHTYHRRSVSSMHLPGALVEGFTFTL